uniref:7TM GPCR serpentine receptor class x (Srx) domain-containing protein n=1 Tax=Globodera rostochiensis TaxID=31243 RepID=A0A914I7A6_GLORO
MNRRQFGVVLSEMGAVQKRIFAQVFLVSLINTFASFLYVYLQSNEVNQWMITFTEFAWFHVHGLPPVIYLAFNKTIRADCRLMFVKLFQSHRIDHIGVVTVVRPKITLMNGTSRNYNAGASSAQAVAKWLITPRGDGLSKIVHCFFFIWKEWKNSKGSFVNAFLNDRLLVRCPIVREEDKWAKSEEEAIEWEWTRLRNWITSRFNDRDIGAGMFTGKRRVK